jgi:hypothetical protein
MSLTCQGKNSLWKEQPSSLYPQTTLKAVQTVPEDDIEEIKQQQQCDELDGR